MKPAALRARRRGRKRRGSVGDDDSEMGDRESMGSPMAYTEPVIRGNHASIIPRGRSPSRPPASLELPGTEDGVLRRPADFTVATLLAPGTEGPDANNLHTPPAYSSPLPMNVSFEKLPQSSKAVLRCLGSIPMHPRKKRFLDVLGMGVVDWLDPETRERVFEVFVSRSVLNQLSADTPTGFRDSDLVYSTPRSSEGVSFEDSIRAKTAMCVSAATGPVDVVSSEGEDVESLRVPTVDTRTVRVLYENAVREFGGKLTRSALERWERTQSAPPAALAPFQQYLSLHPGESPEAHIPWHDIECLIPTRIRTRREGNMRRREIASKFLASVTCERDSDYKERVQQWLLRNEDMDEAAPVGEDEQHGGLLLGKPEIQQQDGGEGGDGTNLEAPDPFPYDFHRHMWEWHSHEDRIQQLVLRQNGIPIVSCSYVHTFETKGEKAERRRLEKVHRDQDAMGLLLPSQKEGASKRLHTLGAIRQTLTTKAKRARRATTVFYKSLLEPSGAIHGRSALENPRTVPDELEKASQGSGVEEAAEVGRSSLETQRLGSSVDDDETLKNTSTGGSRRSSLVPIDDLQKGKLKEYDPYYLDDPEIKSEKRRKLLNMPSVRTTIIPYSKSKDLKKDLNQQFLLTHPWIEVTGLTLTGMRKAKMIMINLALQDDPCLEAATVAYAVVYFEKLIINKIVTKANRKLVAAVCVVLAFKFWEAAVDMNTQALERLLSHLEEHFEVEKKRIIQAEFKVYACLGFEMLVPREQAEPHFNRLLALYNITAKEYLKRKDNRWGLALREEGTATVVKLI